jgi:CheY-like chemotaxis protein
MLDSSIGLSDVARLCRVSPETVRRWVEREGLPCVAEEGEPRVERSALDAFLKSHGNWAPPDRLGGAPRVLVVDDEPEIRSLVARVVRRMYPAAQVQEAADGFEAGQRVMVMEPDIVVLDVHLPGVEGDKVCGRIRACAGFRGVHVLAISGDKDPALREAVMREGADVFLTKPVYPKDLEAAIETLMSKR